MGAMCVLSMTLCPTLKGCKWDAVFGFAQKENGIKSVAMATT